jgi:exodeoxyribonuclease VII large subunit
VGHEVDFSIADFVADQRAATPSAAAELVSLDQEEWFQRLDRMHLQLDQALKRRIGQQRERVGHLRARLRHPGKQLAMQMDTIRTQEKNLTRLVQGRLEKNHLLLEGLTRQLEGHHPRAALIGARDTLLESKRELAEKINRRLISERANLQQAVRLLESLGPENTLARGYAIVNTDDGAILRKAGDVKTGDTLQVRLHRGSVEGTVTLVNDSVDSTG